MATPVNTERAGGDHAVADRYIDVRSVGMTFPAKNNEDTIVIDGLTFGVEAGQFCSIVGPSGCGKSTALRIIDGLTAPTSGEVRVGGSVVTEPSLDIGFVFQQYNLLPWRTVSGNVALALESAGVPRKECAGRARDWLEVVGLAHVGDYYPSQISGGMQQRVGLARALALEPEVLLMDEPFGAVDAQTRVLMQQQLLQIWEKRASTVVFVTHDIEEAIFLSDRVLVMAGDPGRMIADLTVPFSRPRDLSVRSEPEFVRMASQIWDLLHPAKHG